MLLEAGGFDALAARFARLGKADRQAVMASLDPAERARVADALAQHASSPTIEGPRTGGREYAAYSPRLAEIVREAGAADPARSAPTERTRAAIVEAHAAMTASGEVAADSLLSQARRLGARLLGGAETWR